MQACPSVALYVLNWNGLPYLRSCLTALTKQEYPDFQIILIDNDSTDGSVAEVRQTFPDVQMLENGWNAGFSAGNNAGLRRLTADIAVLVNPDVEMAPDWLRTLITPMVEDPTIGVAGCKVLYPDGQTIQHAGGYVSAPQALPGHLGLREADTGQHDAPRDVDYVIGAAMAVRGALLEEIGYFDEGYFLYFEDADLCLRAREAGWRVVYVPAARVIHHESVQTEKGSLGYYRHMHTGRWRYILKHYSTAQILDETLPAEMTWLAERSDLERYALAKAYRAALQMWPSIAGRKRRALGVAAGLDDGAEERIAAVLAQLRLALWQPWPATGSPNRPEISAPKTHLPAELTGRWHLHEFTPPASTIPLLGWLVTAVRRFAYRLFVQPYLVPVMHQQNLFNQALTERLHDLDVAPIQQQEYLLHLAQHAADLVDTLHRRIIEEDRDIIELSREVGRLTYALAHLTALVDPAEPAHDHPPAADPEHKA